MMSTRCHYKPEFSSFMIFDLSIAELEAPEEIKDSLNPARA
jgi:hypothetical protein